MPKTMTVKTDLADYKAQLVNVIPAQMAGKIARDAGLANESGFCPIKPENMQSAIDANIYVLGDACIAGDMPKSAFSANSQAKVAAMMIRGELTKSPTFPARYTNTCWSLIETDDTVKVGGRYEPKDGKIAAVETFVSKTGEDRRTAQADPGGEYGLVPGHHRRHLRVMLDLTRSQQALAMRLRPHRRAVLAGLGATLVAPACRHGARRNARPSPHKVGAIEISIVSDGVLNVPLSFTLAGDAAADAAALFKAHGLPEDGAAAQTNVGPGQDRQRAAS